MKKIILSILIVSTLFMGMTSVFAKTSQLTVGEVALLDDELGKGCDSLLGNPDTSGTVAYYLQTFFNIIKYLGIILCIVLTVVDFAKALFGDNKDMYKELSKKGFQRVIYAVALFFLPILIKFLLMLTDVYDSCGIK